MQKGKGVVAQAGLTGPVIRAQRTVDCEDKNPAASGIFIIGSGKFQQQWLMSTAQHCHTASTGLANSVDGGEQPVANVTDRANSINR